MTWHQNQLGQATRPQRKRFNQINELHFSLQAPLIHLRGDTAVLIHHHLETNCLSPRRD